MAAKRSPVSTHRIVKRIESVDVRPRDYLSEREMELFAKAAKQGRHGARDYAMVLLTYRHGLRVSELVEMRLDQLDSPTAHLWVARKEGSLSAQYPLDGDELRALRAWFRMREGHSSCHLPYVLLSEWGPCTRQVFNYLVEAIATRVSLLTLMRPHMLRHSCGYALANQGRDTRLIQNYLGHKNVQHTVRYTCMAAARLEGLWRKVG
jgi:site-specific recombinase XerD